jgi:hypothetical protein
MAEISLVKKRVLPDGKIASVCALLSRLLIRSNVSLYPERIVPRGVLLSRPVNVHTYLKVFAATRRPGP